MLLRSVPTTKGNDSVDNLYKCEMKSVCLVHVGLRSFHFHYYTAQHQQANGCDSTVSVESRLFVTFPNA